MALRAAARLAASAGPGGEDLGLMAVVSLAGIADFRALRNAHLGARDLYEEFITGALGDEGGDDRWSKGEALGEGMPSTVRVVVLGQSRGDQLVEWGQVELLEQGVKRGRKKGWHGRIRVVELEGEHEVWEEGKEVARCVRLAVDMLEEGEGGGRIESLG